MPAGAFMSWTRLTGIGLLLAAATAATTQLHASRAVTPAAPLAQTAVAPADLVLRGGKIVTVDDARPEAQAMAVRGDTIVALGSDQEIQPYVGPSTQVIDLQGALATPGFIDAHVHFTGVGEAARNLKLSTAKNWDDIVRMVAEAAKTAKPGEWILGRGWHQEKWSEVPVAQRRRLPAARVAEPGLAEQPRVAHARQRPRRVRQRQGDEGGGGHQGDAQSVRRQDPARTPTATRPACSTSGRSRSSARRSRATAPRARPRRSRPICARSSSSPPAKASPRGSRR